MNSLSKFKRGDEIKLGDDIWTVAFIWSHTVEFVTGVGERVHLAHSTVENWKVDNLERDLYLSK